MSSRDEKLCFVRDRLIFELFHQGRHNQDLWGRNSWSQAWGSLERKFYWFLRCPEAPPHWETWKQELTCEHSDRAHRWEVNSSQCFRKRETTRWVRAEKPWTSFLAVSSWAGTKGVCSSSLLLNLMSQLRPESSYLSDCNGPNMSTSLYP